MSIIIALKDLSLQQVCNLLPNINFSILVNIVKEKEIDGLALDSVETLDELVETFSTIPAFKIKALFRKIMELKETGVSPNLLLPQLAVDAASVSAPVDTILAAVTSAPVATMLAPVVTPACRSSSVGNETLSIQSPLSYKFSPLLYTEISFNDAIEDIMCALSNNTIGALGVDELQIAATIAIDYGRYWRISNNKTTCLSEDEIAAICIYTMESPLYIEMNIALRASDRKKVDPFLKYLLLINRALVKCPKPTEGVVFRAFKDDASSFYSAGRRFNWAQLSSSTTDLSAANNFLCSDTGVMQGTLFNIELRGIDCCRDISDYSIMPGESEVLFGLMSRFEVKQSLNTQSGLVMVHIVSIEPIEDILHIEPTPTAKNTSSSPSCSSSSSSFSLSSSSNIIVTNFVFDHKFNTDLTDIDGVLFYIGTKKYTQLYQNPHESGYVVASKSSDGIFGGGDIKSLVGRTSEINATADKEGSWMAVDLGASRSLIINHFCLRYGWSSTSTSIHFPQNFEIQGSNCGTTWEMIQRFEGDIFNNTPACPSPNNFGKNQPWAHWKITTPNVGSFRHFRILQFGPHQGGRYVLALSGLELYGDLTEK